jgi:hypothetical protein
MTEIPLQNPSFLRRQGYWMQRERALIPLRDLLPLRCACGRRLVGHVINLMIIAFSRLLLSKWEKVPKGDEGTLAAASANATVVGMTARIEVRD